MTSRHVLNICFHGVGVPAREREPGESRYWIARDDYLRVLDEIKTWPESRISFDDGNASDVEIGLPALQERGLTATFFVLAGRLDTPGSLSTDDISELRAAGMRIGSHGMDHVPWRGLDEASLRRELVEARKTIAMAAGRPITEAAMPLGRYDRRLLAELRRLGYATVFTSDRRPARPQSWLQPRFSIRSTDTPDTLRDEIRRRPPLMTRLELSAKGIIKRLR